MGLSGFLSLFLRRPVFSDDALDLVLSDNDVRDELCGIEDGYMFNVYLHHTRRYVGYVSLRMGESPALYYLGHIGYRVEREYRGNKYAEHACRLLKPLLKELGLQSVVITTDTDNLPSRKTCEALGCVLERVAPVPEKYRIICSGSKAKCRYIWRA